MVMPRADRGGNADRWTIGGWVWGGFGVWPQ